MNNKCMVDRIDHDLLLRYIEIRRIIHQEVKTLYALSDIMSMFKGMADDKVLIDPHALARVNEVMNESILSIWEKLDDFIPLSSAELAVEELKNRKPASK